MLIKNGTVIDGMGTVPFPADVLIVGDRIADIISRGPVPTVEGTVPASSRGTVPASGGTVPAADEVIDAGGCFVTPGFIDAHAHSDAYLVIEPDAPSKISQGVTTEVNGQCGGSAAPRYGEARLSSDWASLLGDRLTWRSFAEYRAALEAAAPALNVVAFVGHNTLRSSVIGYAGRAATPDEIRQMARLLDESIDAGAKGLTTGLIYQPGKYATPDEVLALATAAARKGGLYATHMRSEGDEILEAIGEVESLAEKSGVRVEISHLKTSGAKNWGKIDAVLEKIESAMAKGLFLGSDRYPYCAAGTDLDVVLPDWAQEGAAKAECERLADAATRRRIEREIDDSGRDWSTVMVGGTWSDETKPFSGRTVAEAAARLGASPGALVCRILEKDLCRTGAFFFTMCEENLNKILSRPWIVPGSDASLRAPWGPLGADHPHPRAYGTMPEFYRRLRVLGVSRTDAVARMTSVPARRFGLRGRGVLARGAFADVAVWREEEFASAATYARPHAFATGVAATVVNGLVAFRPGGRPSRRAGRVL